MVGRGEEPLTGHNYAYQLRVKNKIAKKTKEALEFSFLMGLGVTTACSVYLGGTRGWKLMAFVLGAGVALTEGIAWSYRRAFWKQVNSETELYDKLRTTQTEGETGANWGQLQDFIKMYDATNSKDLQYAAGALWHMRKNDDIQPIQGISMVTAATSAATINTHWYRGGYKKGWFWWLLAAAAHVNLADNVYAWYSDSPDSKKPGALAIGHRAHLAGWLVGLSASWLDGWPLF